MYIMVFSGASSTAQLLTRLLASCDCQIDIIPESDGLVDTDASPLIVIYSPVFEPALQMCDYLAAINTGVNILVIVPNLDSRQIWELRRAGAYEVMSGTLRSRDVLRSIRNQHMQWRSTNQHTILAA